jgi:hypothetical protein
MDCYRNLENRYKFFVDNPTHRAPILAWHYYETIGNIFLDARLNRAYAMLGNVSTRGFQPQVEDFRRISQIFLSTIKITQTVR